MAPIKALEAGPLLNSLNTLGVVVKFIKLKAISEFKQDLSYVILLFVVAFNQYVLQLLFADCYCCPS